MRALIATLLISLALPGWAGAETIIAGQSPVVRTAVGFIGRASLTGAAGEFAHIQLFNPAASGVTVVVRTVSGAIPSTTFLVMSYHNTALTTLVGQGSNLVSGRAASVAEIRTQSNAAELGTLIAQKRGGSTTEIEMLMREEITLPAGTGVLINVSAVATNVQGFFVWGEH